MKSSCTHSYEGKQEKVLGQRHNDFSNQLVEAVDISLYMLNQNML